MIKQTEISVKQIKEASEEWLTYGKCRWSENTYVHYSGIMNMFTEN